MTDIPRLAAWLLLSVTAGWSVLSVIFYKKELLYLPEKIALSYCLGLGLITLEMTALSVFKIPFSVSSIIILWIPVIIAGLAIDFESAMSRTTSKTPSKKDGKFSLLEKFFVFGIGFEIFHAFFRALIKPLEAYDAIAIYALKAKAFYMSASIPADFFKVLGDPVTHPEYPLLLPLAESSIYTFLRSFNDLLVKVIFPLYYVAALVIFYFIVRRRLARRGVLFFTFLLATIPQFSEYGTNGYADLVLACYYSASFYYFFLWMREKESRFLVLSALMSVLCVWTKTEGLMLTAVNIVLAAVYISKDGRSAMRQGIGYIVSVLAIVSAFLYMKKVWGLEVHGDIIKFGPHELAKSAANMLKIPQVLYAYQIQFFGPKKWNLIWVIFILALVFNFKAVFTKNIRMVTLAILLIFLGYTSVYLVTSRDIVWMLSKTTSRFFIHFLPLILLWLAILFKEKKYEI